MLRDERTRSRRDALADRARVVPGLISGWLVQVRRPGGGRTTIYTIFVQGPTHEDAVLRAESYCGHDAIAWMRVHDGHVGPRHTV